MQYYHTTLNKSTVQAPSYEKQVYAFHKSRSKKYGYSFAHVDTIAKGSEFLESRKSRWVRETHRRLAEKGLIRVWIRQGTKDRIVITSNNFDREEEILATLENRHQYILIHQDNILKNHETSALLTSFSDGFTAGENAGVPTSRMPGSDTPPLYNVLRSISEDKVVYSEQARPEQQKILPASNTNKNSSPSASNNLKALENGATDQQMAGKPSASSNKNGRQMDRRAKSNSLGQCCSPQPPNAPRPPSPKTERKSKSKWVKPAPLDEHMEKNPDLINKSMSVFQAALIMREEIDRPGLERLETVYGKPLAHEKTINAMKNRAQIRRSGNTHSPVYQKGLIARAEDFCFEARRQADRRAMSAEDKKSAGIAKGKQAFLDLKNECQDKKLFAEAISDSPDYVEINRGQSTYSISMDDPNLIAEVVRHLYRVATVTRRLPSIAKILENPAYSCYLKQAQEPRK